MQPVSQLPLQRQILLLHGMQRGRIAAVQNNPRDLRQRFGNLHFDLAQSGVLCRQLRPQSRCPGIGIAAALLQPLLRGADHLWIIGHAVPSLVAFRESGAVA